MDAKKDEWEIQNVICPRCGGLIELSEDKTHGICKYCDSEYLLSEDELVTAENAAGIERNISGVHLREISRSRLDDYIFQRMDDETSRKYIRYRYREIIENKMLMYIMLVIMNVNFIFLGYVFHSDDQGMSWLIIAMGFLWLIWLLFVVVPRLFHMTADIKNATGYCEYTFAVLDLKKEMKFICNDGRKLAYKLEEQDDDVFEDNEVVIVHVPSIGKVYAESPGRMRRRFSLTELQRG